MEKLFITELILLNFQDENITSNSDSEPKKERRRPSFNRSKSLDNQVQRKLTRQESAETDGGSGGGGGHSGRPARSDRANFARVVLIIFNFLSSGAAVKHSWLSTNTKGENF